ncbi:MAG TPA: hypothetical protein VIA62_25820 [Thermoanaerobaculia bacterium]|jgi:hypothetical protein|nr:hypothetical protein [Thermoanaerobaculia bacterium]
MRSLIPIVVLLGLFGLAMHGLGRRPAVAGTAAEPGSPPPGDRWWRTRFPPAAATLPSALLGMKLDPARVLPGLACGSLDGARLLGDAGIFVWGWAYDPRTGAPALGVLLLDHGRQLERPVPVFRERPDVAAVKGDRRLIASGWSLWLPAGRATGGGHEFEAFAVLEDHRLGRLGGKVRVGSAGR